MKNEVLKQIINQIKKYELTESFSNLEEFKNWVSKLNNTQINNFLSLDINLEEIRKINYLLINGDLLKCKDYNQKIAAISTLKNGDGCWDRYNNICSPNFLKSKNFYKDIEILSKADTTEYGLQILGEDNFIYSPHHNEDLKLIATTDRKDLTKYYYQENNLINLAINKISLTDKYHLENMQILATNPIASEFLYIIMTDPNFIKGKNYRKEVEALANAKSKTTARALYYYIVNPYRKYLSDIEFLRDYEYDINDAHISDINSVSGSNDPDYLKNLIKINKTDDKFVMHFVSLLMNPIFINSPFKNFDLELLQSISNKPIFMDLYILMNDETSLNNKHHKKDAIIISKSSIVGVRDLLLKKACNEYSLNSINHESDMDFISKLHLDSISEKIYFEIYYYLFRKTGIDDPQHKEKLEKLLQGELVERNIKKSNYLDDLQNQINDSSSQITKTTPIISSKPKSKILSLFKKKKDD